jgi:hypothetical protein
MLSADGTPAMTNLSTIFAALQRRLRVQIRTRVVAPDAHHLADRVPGLLHLAGPLKSSRTHRIQPVRSVAAEASI